MATRKGHGWWPYLLPYFGFMIVLTVAARVPESLAAAFLFLQVGVPLTLVAVFFARGAYPELRGYDRGIAGFALDFGVGIAGAALWMAPYLWFDGLRPESAEGFDTEILGPSWVWLALALRAVGYGLATPFMEELFVRSWLTRYLDVFDRRVDFRDVPLARYSRRSFLGVVIFFTLSHVPWEWWVAVPWIVLTQLWFYHRKHLLSLVIVHAGSNLSILLFAIVADGAFRDGAGNPIDLWFFV